MTTFAIFYKPQDVDAIAAWATNPNIPGNLRTYANRLWNSGLKDWSTAPQAKQDETEACVITPFDPRPNLDPDKVVTPITTGPNAGKFLICDPTMRRVVISGNQVSKQQTIDWLRSLAAADPAAVYMAAIADDIQNTAVEPYTGP